MALSIEFVVESLQFPCLEMTIINILLLSESSCCVLFHSRCARFLGMYVTRLSTMFVTFGFDLTGRLSLMMVPAFFHLWFLALLMAASHQFE